MKRIRRNVVMKAIAALLSTVLLVTMAFSLIVTVLFGAMGAYSDPAGFREEILTEILYAEANQVEWHIYDALCDDEQINLSDRLSPARTNLRFTVTDTDGNIILTNESAPSAVAKTYTFTLSVDVTEREYTMSCSFADPLPVLDLTFYAYHFLDAFTAYRWAFPCVAIGAILLLAILLPYLCWASGYRKNREEPTLNLIDRIPLDLYLVILIGFGTLLIVGWMFAIEEALDIGTPDLAVLFAVLGVICLLVLTAMMLSLLLTVVTRIKCHTWLRNTVLWRIGALIRKVCKKVWRGIRFCFETLPLYWKTGVITVVLLILELIALSSNDIGFIAFCFLIGNLILIPVAIYCVIQFRRLHTAAKRIAEGDTACQVDTAHLVAELKSHAEALNGIGAGMQKAVDERMKSERFKTELITNVSHDIKTPLTSIINYVDLLKKEEIESDTVREYVDVLDRQSARLKKLIEDLLEASKASTGNLTVNTETLELNLLLSQAVAEFRDKLDAKELTVVMGFAEDSHCKVTADGRLLWRVCENLFSNVCKYAQEQTRVYISSEVRGDKIRLTVKNTSKYALNVPGEELMERFTRGDASRHTEGSGLGLSIARSLVELQKGSFAIVTDGDLFKVTVDLPRA
ncbi:MAG: sensor histidine kinase [Eubacteriales bacterium]